MREPTSSVVAPDRCLGEVGRPFETCRYYVGGAGGRRGLQLQPRSPPERMRTYPPIHMMYVKVTSGCPFYELKELTGGFAAVCRALGRLLTKSEALRCGKHWETCPIREHAQLTGDRERPGAS